jgi:hypothetical protein
MFFSVEQHELSPKKCSELVLSVAPHTVTCRATKQGAQMFDRDVDYPTAVASYDDDGVDAAIDWCVQHIRVRPGVSTASSGCGWSATTSPPASPTYATGCSPRLPAEANPPGRRPR